MTGLLLLAVLGGWLVISFLVARWIFRVVKPRMLGVIVAALVFSVLVVAPLADEIVGKHQFDKLCTENGRKELDFQKIAGRTVLSKLGSYYQVNNTILRVTGSEQQFLDPNGGDQLVSYRDYRSEGGWLIHALKISETNAPLLFQSGCGGYDQESVQGWLDRYQVKLIFK